MVGQRSIGRLISRGRTAEVFEYGEGCVLKLFERSFPLGRIEAEAETARVVHDSGAPVPAVWERVEIDGRSGLVYQRVSGETMLMRLQRRPWLLPAMARLLAEVHAELHQLRVPALERQAARFRRQLRADTRLSEPLQDLLLQRLAELETDARALCHGDFHPDNVILCGRKPYVIDLLTATAGDPCADVARTRLMLEIAQPERPLKLFEKVVTGAGRRMFARIYLSRYLQLMASSESRLEAWQPIVVAARLEEGMELEEAPLRARLDAWAVSRLPA